jgi:flagellar basal-body rod protein FlgG
MTIQALYTAGTGMGGMQSRLDVVANNLANMETTAFKAGRANFEDSFYRNDRLPGLEDTSGQLTPMGISYGTGVRVESVQDDHSQGALQKTDHQLDVAIEGVGYFKVRDPNGDTYYTRAGNFTRNANGNIVLGSANVGRLLDPPITIPNDATAISIGTDGKVLVQQPNNTQLQQVGQIEMAMFINPGGLLKLGENLYRETDASGSPINANPGLNGMGTVQQEYLEASNVEPTTELIDLIKTQRAFELNSQVVQAGNEMMQLVANLRRS